MNHIYKLLSLIIVLVTTAYPQTEYRTLNVGIHFDSKVSRGKYTLQELGDIIAREGLDAAIITDHDNMEVEFGLPLLENLVKFKHIEPSIRTYGEERYIREIEELNQKYPGVIFIPGIEAVPCYFWSGSILDNDNPLMLNQWHEHLLVIGLDKPQDYRNLPSLANGFLVNPLKKGINTFLSKYLIFYLLLLIYSGFFLYGVKLIFKKRHRKRSKYQGIKVRRKKTRSFGVFLVIVFGLLLANKYPFLPREYTPYKFLAGAGPYQSLVDYVNNKDGMVFWAHPEVAHKETVDVDIWKFSKKIVMNTDEYSRNLIVTKDYTGFAIFHEGMKKIGRPRGVWDRTLREYATDLREKPVWAIGELDFEESNDLNLVKETLTHVLVKSVSKEGILEALKAGRMYTTRNYAWKKMRLRNFSVSDGIGGKRAIMGESLQISEYPVVRISIDTFGSGVRETILLIRNGNVIERFRLDGDFSIRYRDYNCPKGVSFYRVLVGEDYSTLATNPIFIER